MYMISNILDLLEKFKVSFILTSSFSMIVNLILFVISGLALFKMQKNLNLKNPWICFVPLLNIFAIGRVAQVFIKKNGMNSAKFGPILLIVYIIKMLCAAAFLVLFTVSLNEIILNASKAIENDVFMTLSMFSSLIPVIALYFVFFALAVTYDIIYFVALWRIFSVFCNENATLFTVLSIFFKFLIPFFLFFNRNREPKFTHEEREHGNYQNFDLIEEN